MRTAIFYFLMGILFTYMAIQSVEDTVWNVITILLALVATLDFGVGIRFMRLHFKMKKEQNHKH